MNPDLSILVWSVVLTFVLVLIAVLGALMQVGLLTLVANREGFPEITGWAGRACRAHLNMIENMALFIPLVLIAVIANKTNSTTLLGAQIFLWARVAHALIYIIGIPWARTATWTVSVIGLIMIFSQLL
ncbi:MAG: hypothetical protein A2W18_00635 [Candidatus Muproteobacteria bacterium RBG_16_60_9]|uniref:MAPEG family protein n=1 Tax=Candidatus Muproteobacteria bacterium RBG_16_60_9 TaxID=1817755 RepID=A0A1F6V598_9PROT|nr:MAG: hypothetical protein A2W18_00635 [Candidatus Muproteobacteria bacterium RBG_16_60_9]